MNDTPSVDYRNKFSDHASVFKRLAEKVGEEEANAREHAGDVLRSAPSAELLRRQRRLHLSNEYRDAVSAAGGLCVEANAAGLLGDVDGLAELVAAQELGEWEGLVHDNGNLFALLAGGPGIELRGADGAARLHEKEKPGRPFQYSPLSPRDPIEAFRQALGDNPLPDCEQCVHYEEFCEMLVQLLPVHRVADESPKPKKKKSTTRGEAEVKMVAALTKHHQYAEDGCLNGEPIGVAELARLAGVAKSSASVFFGKRFDGHDQYKFACGDVATLLASIKLLNNEFSPRHLISMDPTSDEDSCDEDSGDE